MYLLCSCVFHLLFATLHDSVFSSQCTRQLFAKDTLLVPDAFVVAQPGHMIAPASVIDIKDRLCGSLYIM